MKISEINDLVRQFLTAVAPMLGNASKNYDLSEPVDAADLFGEEEMRKIKKDSGVYLYWDKKSGQVIYVGMGKVKDRFVQHIGPGFCWARNGTKASFPNSTLVSDEKWWVNKDMKKVVQNAEFNVTCIFPENHDISRLIESFLIYFLHTHGTRIGGGILNASF